MTRLRAIFLIARREFLTRVRTRVFIIGTAVIVVGIAGYLALQILVINKSNNTTTDTMAFNGPAATLAQPMTAAAASFHITIKRKTVADDSDGKSQVQSGKLDALVTGPATAPTVFVNQSFDSTLQTLLQSVVRERALADALTSAGVNPATVEAQLAKATVTVTALKTGGNSLYVEEAGAGFIAAVLLYVGLVAYGNFIAQGVVEEKANRIVEILLSTVRPTSLLTGKIIGIGLVGLFQLAIIGLSGFILALLTHIFTVPTLALNIVLIGILWFVLGFFLYAFLYAAVGSLVSRTEEVQSVSLPITMVVVAAYLAAIDVVGPMLAGQPMTTTGKLIAMIPFVSPVIMPAAMATGSVSWWQAALSVLLTLLTAVLAAWIAARIYSNSVLRIGARVKLREAFAGDRRAKTSA